MGLLSLVIGFVAPWPMSPILIVLGIVIAITLFLTGSNEAELAAQARNANDDPDLMTVWEVAEAAGMPTKSVVRVLNRDGVSRADARGWRARAPVAATKIRYRRSEIARWLDTRERSQAAK